MSLYDQINTVAYKYIWRANSRHPQPRIIFTDDPDSNAGMSWKSSNTIELNLCYFTNNEEEMLYQILPHELAHLLVPEEDDDHGPLWQAMMLKLGARAEAEHEMQI